MEEEQENDDVAAAFAAVIGAASLFNQAASTPIPAIAAEVDPKERKPDGRYKRRGSLHQPKDSFCANVLRHGHD